MERFIKSPNIPAGAVRAVLLGARYAERLAAPLDALGIRTVAVENGEGLDTRVSAHADMLAHHLGENEWMACKSAEKALKQLKNIQIYTLETALTDTYPCDIALNLLRLDDAVYGRLDATSPLLLEHLSKKEIEQVSVRQGYAKCSVCVVNRRAAITADNGLAEAMSRRGVDVLKISPGGILLEGYDTGFIGGASGLIAPDKLALTGRLDSLPDAAQTRAFLKKHNVTPIELTDSEMFDVGSILPIVEEI